MKTRIKWTVEDYRQKIEAGIMCDRKVELLAGENHQMAPEEPLHAD